MAPSLLLSAALAATWVAASAAALAAGDPPLKFVGVSELDDVSGRLGAFAWNTKLSRLAIACAETGVVAVTNSTVADGGVDQRVVATMKELPQACEQLDREWRK